MVLAQKTYENTRTMIQVARRWLAETSSLWTVWVSLLLLSVSGVMVCIGQHIIKSSTSTSNVLKENPFKTYIGFCSTIKVTLQQASKWMQWIKWFWTCKMMLAAGNRAIGLWWPAQIIPCIRQRNSPCSRVPTVTGNRFEFKVRQWCVHSKQHVFPPVSCGDNLQCFWSESFCEFVYSRV